MEISRSSGERYRTAKRTRGLLIEDPSLYIESLGRTDQVNIVPNPQSPAEKEEANVRLFLGATKSMTYRALSYVQSAVEIANALDNVAQLQIVHVNTAGQEINGVNKLKADDQAKRLAEASFELIESMTSSKVPILHAIDTPHDMKQYEPLAQRMFDENPHIAQKLIEKGAKHSGNPIAYAAIHFAFQDTEGPELRPIIDGSSTQISRERVISVGCGQERIFYMARMAMRQMGHDNMIDETAQVFTRHLTPPYYSVRGGEPSLEEGLLNGIDLGAVNDQAVRRDIEYFINMNNK